MNPNIRDLIKAAVAILVAIVFSQLKTLPGFPDIPMDPFVELIVWALMLLIFGKQMFRINARRRASNSYRRN